MAELPPGDRPRPCFENGSHYPACTGYTTAGRACKGCLPRFATQGRLCAVCHDRYIDALSRVGDLTHHLRSVEKSGQALGERVASSREPRLPIPESWLAADTLVEALGCPPIPASYGIDDAGRYAHGAAKLAADYADDDVLTVEGATRAVVLVRRMHQALARWPDSETASRRIPHVRCPRCQEQTLARIAPQVFGEDMLVRCTTETCVYEHEWFTWWADAKPFLEFSRTTK